MRHLDVDNSVYYEILIFNWRTLYLFTFFTGDGRGTRSLWNNGNQIIWYHFHCIVNDQMNLGLKSVPKLTHEHVHLNPYSVMNVRLAAQILSNTLKEETFAEETFLFPGNIC